LGGFPDQSDIFKMNIKTFALKDLTPAEYNPRSITPEALSGLKRSIEEFGYIQPIIVNTHNGNAPTIVGGHQRLKAMLAQGVKAAKCVVVDFDPIKEKAANVALNAETISGDWELEGLEAILEELKFEFPEFEDVNLDDLAGSLEIDLEEIPEHDPELPTGDHSGLRVATFTFSEEQFQLVDSLIKEEIKANPILDDPSGLNENKNGNALYWICKNAR
jgi:hypothetical protein